MKRVLLVALCAPVLAVSAALAETCPPPPDHSAALDALFGEARQMKDDRNARDLSMRMWRLWAEAPNPQAQAILDRGMRMREEYNFLGALQAFDRLVEYCPDYAEGYNQRAFVHYLTQNYEAALGDLDLALDRSPRHVAAISGRALTLMALNRIDEARDEMARALELNPWIPERGLAAPGGPLAPLGEDI